MCIFPGPTSEPGTSGLHRCPSNISRSNYNRNKSFSCANDLLCWGSRAIGGLNILQQWGQHEGQRRYSPCPPTLSLGVPPERLVRSLFLTFPAEINNLAMIWQLHVCNLPSCLCYIFLQKSDGRGE